MKRMTFGGEDKGRRVTRAKLFMWDGFGCGGITELGGL